ncbi:MAG: 4-hydroxy-tetrahydrodipicolinate synthase [Microthrixaceae bacterium]
MGARFGRVVTAMVTPFDERGDLDLDAAAELAQWLVETGSEGLVLAGTTGESPALTDSEALALFRRVRETVSVPVLAGTGSNSTAHAVELTRRAAETGVDGILSVTPYYNRPSQAGIEAHFRAVAAATDLPVLIYDIPVRTGRKVATDVLARLAREVANVVGVKDAAGNPAETARLMAAVPSDFELYSGDDNMTLPLLAVGAVGVISVASHWVARQMLEMVEAVEKGDLESARKVNARLLASYDFETGDDAPNPVPTKALLKVLGLRVGECRPPMGPAPDGIADRARAVLDGLA